MTSLLLFTVTLLCAATISLASVELTDQNFYEYAKDRGSLLVDFYAPWCSDCVKLQPEYERAAMKLGSRGSDMAKVDCFGAGKCICDKLKIKSWPQLKTFRHGVYTGEYIGQQTGDEMANYVNYAAVSSQYVDNALSRQMPVNTCAQRHAVATPDSSEKDDKTAAPEPGSKSKDEKPKALGTEDKEETVAVPDTKAKDEVNEKPAASIKDNSASAKVQAEPSEKSAEVDAAKKTPFVEATAKDTLTLNPSPGTTVHACIKCDIPKAGKPKKTKKKEEKKSSRFLENTLKKKKKKAMK